MLHFSSSSNDTFRTWISQKSINSFTKSVHGALGAQPALSTKAPNQIHWLWRSLYLHLLCVDSCFSASSESTSSGHFGHRTKHSSLCPLCKLQLAYTKCNNKSKSKGSVECCSKAEKRFRAARGRVAITLAVLWRH